MKDAGVVQGSPPPPHDNAKLPTEAQKDQAYWNIRRSDVVKMRERREKKEYEERNGLTKRP